MSFTVHPVQIIDLPAEDVTEDPTITQPTPPDRTVTAADAAAIRARLPACSHCGGWHDRACPRVRSMRFHASGALAGVDFWADGKWSDAYVLWPEDLVDDDE